MTDGPRDVGTLEGFRIGVTASRKAEEQCTLLERRGAEVVWVPLLSEARSVAGTALRAGTDELLRRSASRPVDLLLATTGVGLRAWFAAAEAWGLRDELVVALDGSEILARGPKTLGALRAVGLRETWSPASEQLDDVVAHLAGRDLSGQRVVIQEHGQSLEHLARELRDRGADVELVTVYRIGRPDGKDGNQAPPGGAMVDLVAQRAVDAVTFTAAPAVDALMQAAEAAGLEDEVARAFREDVIAVCVGPVTAAAFDAWDVPTVHPTRSRTAAMVRLAETELPRRRTAKEVDVAGRRLFLRGDRVHLDGVPVHLPPVPLAVLRALADRPGHVVSRRDLLEALPTAGGSEHGVEMAVARLRTALGADVVRTVVKRGYRLAAP